MATQTPFAQPMEGADEDEAAATLTGTAAGGDDKYGQGDDADLGAGGACGDEQQAGGACCHFWPCTRARALGCPKRRAVAMPPCGDV